jgi:hypothetical protein
MRVVTAREFKSNLRIFPDAESAMRAKELSGEMAIPSGLLKPEFVPTPSANSQVTVGLPATLVTCLVERMSFRILQFRVSEIRAKTPSEDIAIPSGP